jgi:NitT/TauT family transport system substrate-binding protein
VIAVKKDKAGQVKSAADFKGLKIGVTAPGLLDGAHRAIRDGEGRPEASDAAIIGIGAGASAVAAMKKGEIDVISHLDP